MTTPNHPPRRGIAGSLLAILMSGCCTAACSGAGASAKAGSVSAGGATTTALEGAWTRPIGSQAKGREAICLGTGGTLGLIGLPSMNGLTWSVEGNQLVLGTNTAGRPTPREVRLGIESFSADDLELAATGEAGYLAGRYRRDDGACRTVTGTITYRQRMALRPTAALHVVLSDVSRVDTAAMDIAWLTLPAEGKQVPVSFQLFYDPSTIHPEGSYAVRASITDGGERIFISRAPYPVITRGAPTRASIVVTPFSESPSQDPAQADALRLRGLVVYMADAARFTDCSSGRDYPVAMGGDYPSVEDAYLNARTQPGAPVLMSIEGRYEFRPGADSPRVEPTLSVVRYGRAWSADSCDIPPDAPLEGTEWRLVDVGHDFARSVEGVFPRLRLIAEGRKVEGTTGCNGFTGSYRLEGSKLSFPPFATTMRICEEGGAQETAFLQALVATSNFRIDGDLLLLYEGEARLARLRAEKSP